MTTNSRRRFMGATGLLALAAALPATMQTAWAAVRSGFSADKLEDSIKSVFNTGAYEASDAVKMKSPEIAENGAVVPITVKYEGGQAKRIAVFVEQNPFPLAAMFDLPERGIGDVSVRLKMGESSMVHAVVEDRSGKVFGVAKEVKVTIGGCGG